MILGLLFFSLNSLASVVHYSLPTHNGFHEFYLHLPETPPKGLVVMLHGCKTKALEFDEGTGVSALALERGFAVLYPEQSILSNSDRCWNWFWNLETNLIANEVKLVQTRYSISRNQTVLMGMSAGGAQASLLANCSRHLFSRVLIHSGLAYLAATSLSEAEKALLTGSVTKPTDAARKGFLCNPSTQPVEFWVVHGDQDHRVAPINGHQTAEEFLMLNAALTHANGKPGIIQAYSQENPGDAFRLAYESTDFYLDHHPIGKKITVHGLEHEWSGGNPIQPRNNPKGPPVARLFLDALPANP